MENTEPPRRPGGKRADLQLIVSEPAELMAFLIAKLPHKNRNNIKSLLRNKQILIDGKVYTQFNHPLQPEQVVTVAANRAPETSQYRGLTLLYEDPDIIVINKQAGLLSMATAKERDRTAYGILSDYVKKENPKNKIFIIHRLDRETSGVMMFARSENVQQLMQESWNSTTKQRTYVALVEGVPKPPEGTITSYLRESKALIVYSSQNPDNGQLSVTNYRVAKAANGYALVELELETGRKNQIRVHMSDIGHPIAGDTKYGAQTDPIGRLGLHAETLAFTHPITGEAMRFDAPVPKTFLSIVKERGQE
ncbi:MULTISPECIES: RluA family pseudouridine synthase [unclassified Spirosoma]|uniref:RluA family pseudouridine synthase n=1 Tax=unclassified Spirosoma TaxID=2621999 RepID=UPI00096806B1|nr:MULTISPECIES: RluA family pseudouridine synthase [unclassified Spirosoma]MBN8820502.1 RluA family pseudouridine synthase [Spirosoma sp.]OJW71289.1 MAG: RNA pseudouridine synthase [Spirosoma sp. 48-14]